MAELRPSLTDYIGLRVIRGHRWMFGKQGGGSGHVGTIISFDPLRFNFLVQWDNGDRTTIVYPGQNDVLVLDVAQIGVFHPYKCSSCGKRSIRGFKWKCLGCDGKVNLCSSCYHNDKHNPHHEFSRHDSAIHEGVEVGTREGSDKIRVKGIFQSAVVTLCHPGYNVKPPTGKVKGVYNLDTSLYPSVIVQWRGRAEPESYQLGKDGTVALKYIKDPASGGKYYWRHLPCPWELSPGKIGEAISQHLGMQPGELTLSPGETVAHVVALNQTWCLGVVRGVQGRFPERCIQTSVYDTPFDQKVSASSEELSSGGSFPPKPPPLREQSGSPSTESRHSESSFSDPKEYSADSASIDMGLLRRINSAEKMPKYDQTYGIALYDYSPRKGGDLSFEQYDIITNIISSDDNWWQGNVNGQTGYFPKNFVKIIVGDEETVSVESEHYLEAVRNSEIETEASDAYENLDQGVNVYGNVQGAFSTTTGRNDHQRAKTGVPTFKARCIHNYKARTDDELSMKEDDVIHDVVNIEDDWWTGVLHDQSGRFPARYVEKISESTSRRHREPPTVVSEVTYL